MDCVEKGKVVIDVETRELARLRDRLDDSFTRAVHLIREAVEARHKVVVVGVGKSGLIGEKIAATLTSTGAPAVVLNSLNALHGDLGVVSDGDVILALSYSGETEELNNIIPALSRFDIRMVSITGNPKSFLARSGDVHLDANVEKEACPLQLAPTSSTTTMLALGDALAMVLLELRGFKREDFARYHPGGRLGRGLLLKVQQIMRPAAEMARVAPEMPVQDVLREMTRLRAGAAVVVDAGDVMLGIFTHGDFARHFQEDPMLGPQQVADFMTSDPITINAGKLAVEVLNVLERHRIDDLVVVDDNNHPVGIVDSQDLTRAKLL